MLQKLQSHAQFPLRLDRSTCSALVHQADPRPLLAHASSPPLPPPQGVMQMDLKSENILLTASGTAKLADVGFSRNRAVAADDTPLRGTFSW